MLTKNVDVWRFDIFKSLVCIRRQVDNLRSGVLECPTPAKLTTEMRTLGLHLVEDQDWLPDTEQRNENVAYIYAQGCLFSGLPFWLS